MAEVIEINSLPALEPYRLAWQALLPHTPRASFFHSYDWLAAYWRHFGQDQQLRVLIIRSQGKTIGIVPLCVRTETYHTGKLRVLTYPLQDWGSWYGPIGPNPSACFLLALEHLRSTERNWDMLDLRWVAAEKQHDQALAHAISQADWTPYCYPYQQTSVIECAGSDWEQYQSQLPKKWRHEIRRQGRVLERKYRVSMERHRPGGAAAGDQDPRWDLYDACLHVSEQSWQGNSHNGNTLCHANVREFLRECHGIAAKLGMLDLAVLKLDNQPVAFQYNYVCQGNVYGLRMGYDPKFSQYGVGKNLVARLVEDSFQRGDKKLDFGSGDFDFKRRFRTAVDTSYRLGCYRWDAWRSQGVRLTRWLKGRLGYGVATTPPAEKQVGGRLTAGAR